MSFIYKIFIFSIYLIVIHIEIEYSSCENGLRTITFENGETKKYQCIFCPINQYTIYNEDNNELSCINCNEGTSNYGPDIIINSFSKKILSRYSYTSSEECYNNNNNNIYNTIDLCPKWEINPLSLRVSSMKGINSKSLLAINQYYMNDGELIIKYINYNGGISKYFIIYINDVLVYKDDSEHSIIKTRKFDIKKGYNFIKFEYIIDNNLSSKGNIYDDDSYLQIFEIQMLKAETSSLDCKKYDTIEQLKNTIHNNCDYYINKCTNDIYCTFRFYSEIKSEYCNTEKNNQNITYDKISGGICEELIPPPDKQIVCDHCTYGQYLYINKEKEISKCIYCNESSYNNKTINDEETCEGICDDKKQLIKIIYSNNLEDPSEYINDKININTAMGFIGVNYVKFNELENCNVFVEINDLTNDNNSKTIELINPNEEEETSLDDDYFFNIPIEKGIYNITIKGKNLKINKISIKGTENGGNYKCVDTINTDQEETCPNDDEYYSVIENKCIKCTNGSIINDNKNCFFIEQFINNKFVLDNNNLLRSNIMNNSYQIISS